MATTNLTYGLPSPANSTRSPAPSSINMPSTLPTPRAHPLRPGSTKESGVINYLDARVNRIQARFAKRVANDPQSKDADQGYENFDEIVADIDPLVDVAWASGTPYIQIAYLLSLAGLFCTYMPEFPFVVSIFRLASKFDTAFSLIIRASTDDSTTRGRLSRTDKVRIKSLAEDTRVVAVKAAAKSGHNPEVLEDDDDDDEYSATATETETENEHDGDLDSMEDVEMHSLDPSTLSKNLSRMYEQTISLLGDVLGDLPPQAVRPDTNTNIDSEVEEIEL